MNARIFGTSRGEAVGMIQSLLRLLLPAFLSGKAERHEGGAFVAHGNAKPHDPRDSDSSALAECFTYMHPTASE